MFAFLKRISPESLQTELLQGQDTLDGAKRGTTPLKRQWHCNGSLKSYEQKRWQPQKLISTNVFFVKPLSPTV